MKSQVFIDKLAENIAVEIDEVKSAIDNDGVIHVSLEDGTEFEITVREVK